MDQRSREYIPQSNDSFATVGCGEMIGCGPILWGHSWYRNGRKCDRKELYVFHNTKNSILERFATTLPTTTIV
jgi:hypothetical protein